ncbi:MULTISPECIES: winged helix-turn-helix transcriptional regulator [Planococcus]|uniref:Transcriptional regulator n=1 Tax=Planococcus versutus TaxID=1302659 RepID=A0A1B1S541_9BACL|nr:MULTISPECIES: helix-turn-helix domain-containing protein [Planococcus]AIY05477.1 transcriptional regulator, HxlR family [Planococcus sp. PAMC 21323]ANU28295.1 transcriptional regulator [Planococcus versutus]
MATECNGGIETALDLLVGKWKPVILFHLMNNGILRFSELQRSIPGITKKMLTTQLRELEYHNIVNRKVYAQVPPKVEYSITEYGKGLAPTLLSMHEWGFKHLEHLNKLYGTHYEDQIQIKKS